MNKYISRYLFYYPVTILRGEWIASYFNQYEKLQRDDAGVLHDFQLKHLIKLLNHAINTVPIYKQLYADAGIKPEDMQSLEDIKRLPMISKGDIVARFNDFQSLPKRHFVSSKTTGGSTGQAVTILKNVDALARERAATWVAYKWAGVEIGDPQARFWGVPLSRKRKLIYKVVDLISNRRRLSAFNINARSLENYYRKLLRLEPVYFYGYVSIITEFAKYVIENNYPRFRNLKCIITTSEVLDDKSRHLIESAFKVKVFNEYGCGEVGSIAHECEHGNLHIMAQNLIVETDETTGKGEGDGEIVVTDLHNYSMPLIRYKLGDYATLSDCICECGRKLPIIKKVHGRAYDVIIDPDGNKHHPEILMYIFEELKARNKGIKQFQVIQKSVNNLFINLVADAGYQKATEAIILAMLREKIHPNITLEFDYVDHIDREKSGKMRVIKSELN